MRARTLDGAPGSRCFPAKYARLFCPCFRYRSNNSGCTTPGRESGSTASVGRVDVVSALPCTESVGHVWYLASDMYAARIVPPLGTDDPASQKQQEAIPAGHNTCRAPPGPGPPLIINIPPHVHVQHSPSTETGAPLCATHGPQHSQILRALHAQCRPRVAYTIIASLQVHVPADTTMG